MSTYAIGDIHGCFDSLSRLWDGLPFDEEQDRLWLVGDLINRGPRSAAVLRWAREREASLGDRFQLVLGNHDLHFLAVHWGICPARHKDRFDPLLAAADGAELAEWLAARPLLHRAGDHLLVHAGLLPSWSPEEAESWARQAERALATADGRAELLTRGGEKTDLRHAFEALTRLRTCTAEGQPCDHNGPPAEAPPGCLPWFRIPGRRSAEVTVVCGHWAALGLHLEPRVIALDTGCAWGGSLTAIRLEDRRLFQQPALEPAPMPASETR